MVDLNNMEQVTKMTESCQILSDTLNLVEKNIVPGQSVLELDKIAEDFLQELFQWVRFLKKKNYY